MKRVRKLTTSGVAVVGVLVGVLFSATPALAGEGFGISGEFGSPGSGAGELSLGSRIGSRSGLAINYSTNSLAKPQGEDIYVADTNNNRVEWFNSAGQYAGQFNGTEIDGVPAGAGKEAPAKLSAPEDIAVDSDPGSLSDGDVYVVVGGGKVDKFSATGEFLFQFSSSVGEFGNILPPSIAGIATDPSGDVWVAGREGEASAQEFSNAVENTPLTPLVGIEGDILGLAVDSEDNLYTKWGGKVRKNSKTGAFLGTVCQNCAGGGLTVEPGSNDLLTDTGTSIAQYGSFGEPFAAPVHVSDPGILTGGAGIAVNPTSHEVYVAEAAHNRIVTLVLGPTPEKPETLPPEEPKSTSAIFRGKLNQPPPPVKLKYYFEYNVGASCVGGATTPVKEGEGTVSEEVTGLEPGVEYTYCFVAENGNGPTSGDAVSFPSPPAAPVVISESASNPNYREEAVFTATINPNNSTGETTSFFEYSTKASGETIEEPKTVAAEGTIGAGVFGEETVHSDVAEELVAEETYYYRIVTKNATGTTAGKVQAYTKLPAVTGYEEEVYGKQVSFPAESASGVTLTEATLKAGIEVNYQTNKYYFEYSTNKETVAKDKGIQVPGKELEIQGGNPAQPASVVLSGLSANTPYYYRVVAENTSTENLSNADKGEPVRGGIEEFTTRSLPFVSTGAAQSITRTTATLSGTMNSRFVNATYYFAYIDQAGYEKALAGDAEEKADPYVKGETTTPITADAGESEQPVGPILAGGLLPGTTYHYALVSKNEFGIRYGEDHTLTTLAATPPIVITGGVSGVSQNAATLTGTVATNSLQTNYGFEIGTEPGEHYGPATGLGAIGGAQTEEVHVTLGELQPGTTYYYRVEASNADGTEKGQPGSFTTPGFPTLVATPSSPPLIATPAIAFPKEEAASGAGTAPKGLTNAQKLKKALKACHAKKGKSARAKCEKQAHARYGGKGKKK